MDAPLFARCFLSFNFCVMKSHFKLDEFEIIYYFRKFTVVQSAPPTPPSNAQASRSQQDETVLEYIKSLWKLMKNPSFVLIFFAYSMSIAVYSAMTTFLNQMIIPLYPVSRFCDFHHYPINCIFRTLKMTLVTLEF